MYVTEPPLLARARDFFYFFLHIGAKIYILKNILFLTGIYAFPIDIVLIALHKDL